MLTKIKKFVKQYQSDIILLIGVILISLLSFAAGFIVAKQQKKEPIRIEQKARSEFSQTNLRIYQFSLWNRNYEKQKI